MADSVSQCSALVDAILKDKFNLQSGSFTVKEIDHAKNNHVYLICLAQPTTELLLPKDSPPKPFTSAIPANTSRLVLRVPKSNVSLENSVRVRNEVAFLALARDALSSLDASLCPRVFSWEDMNSTSLGSGSSLGWILEEWKAGQVLEQGHVEGLDNETQQYVLDQISQVTKLLQEYCLPENVGGFGGLTFDEDGNMSNTATTIPCGGPFQSYGDFLSAMCAWQLSASERSSHLNGWRDVPKLRQRLDAFLASGGVDKVLSNVPEQKPTMVHADLCLPNLLFDTSNYRLTAVLDFDFAHIGAPISEYLFSFWDLDGILPGSAEPLGPLRKWLLTGFPKKVDSKYKIAKAWDDSLAKAGVQRPSTIEGASDLADIWWFSQEICQAFWFIDRIISSKSPEALKKLKDVSARNLDRYLSQWKY